MEGLRELIGRAADIAWHRRWYAVAAAWAVCLGGWFLVTALPNQYEASARVFIDSDAVLTPLLKGIAVDSSLSDQLDLLQEMLLSRPNLEKIIAKTDLSLDATTPLETEQMVARLATRIHVVPQTRNLFSISYRATSRQLATDVVRTVLASFMENKAGDNRDEMEKASKFLDDQIASYEAQLRTAEAKRAQFRKTYVDLLPGDGGLSRLDAAKDRVSLLEGQLEEARARRSRLADELAHVPVTVAGRAVMTAGDSGAELRTAEAKLHELERIYTPQYPDVVSQKQLVETLRAGARSAPLYTAPGEPNPVYTQLKVTLVETDASIDSTARKLADATAERDRLAAIARGVPALEAQYLNMNRDYDVLRKNYDELLARRESMRIANAAQTRASNVKLVIIDPPNAPQRPVAPNRPVLALGVLVAGLAAAAGTVAAFFSLDQSFRSTLELRTLGLPVLGSVSLAVTPVGRWQRVRRGAVLASAFALLFVALGSVLARFSGTA